MGELLRRDDGYTVTPAGQRRREIAYLAKAGDLASAFSPRGGWIVYAMTSAPRGGLVLVRADGRGDEQRLTDPMALGLADADDFWPAFAPDGKRIAFTRGYGSIWTIRPDGTGLHKIVDRGREPDWSPDGRRIVYEFDSTIWTARADGTHVRRIHQGFSPAFSPDGRRIAFMGRFSSLYTMNLRGRHVLGWRRQARTQVSSPRPGSHAPGTKKPYQI